jgi:putative nucleotidyltransferase with HDIG domain
MSSANNLEKINAYIGRMPSLPVTVTKVLEICNNPKTSPTDLNRIISLDPVLMGRVLKLINSAYYGLGQQVTSLVRAIIMLGINTVKNLALSTAVVDNLSDRAAFQAINMDGFWRHSLCVGVTSRMVAKKRGVDQRSVEEYFAAGLLHDLGKIPMNNVLSKEYVLAMSMADRERLPLYFAEKREIDTDHSEVGTIIAQSWKLDRAIVDTVNAHHAYLEYDGPYKDILYTVVLANYFANIQEIGFSGDRYPERIDPSVYQFLGLTRDIFEEIESGVTAEIENARIFLKTN